MAFLLLASESMLNNIKLELEHEEKVLLATEIRKLRWDFICKVDIFSLGHFKSKLIRPAFLDLYPGKIRVYL